VIESHPLPPFAPVEYDGLVIREEAYPEPPPPASSELEEFDAPFCPVPWEYPVV